MASVAPASHPVHKTETFRHKILVLLSRKLDNSENRHSCTVLKPSLHEQQKTDGQLGMFLSFLTDAKNGSVFHVRVNQGPIFRTFFSTENHFPRKIPRNFLEKRFFKTFSAENSIFSQHFWGKIFRGIFPEILPGKK
jgi:hypothetical protein